MQPLDGFVGGLGPLHEKGDGDQPEEEEEAQAVLAGVIEDLCHGQVPLSGGHRCWGAGAGGSERGGRRSQLLALTPPVANVALKCSPPEVDGEGETREKFAGS